MESLQAKSQYLIIYWNQFNWQVKRATRQWKFCLWNNFWAPKMSWQSRSWSSYTKLNCYSIRGVADNWFPSYLQNESQYVSINGVSCSLEHIHCGASQGSILGPLLFLICINDLNYAIRHCSILHFADYTNLLNCNTSVKAWINKLIKT